VELCRLHGNGRGGWEGIVDGSSEKIDAFLLDAVEPEHVGAGQEREWEGAHLLCRVWKRRVKQGYYGKISAGMPPKNNWAWDLPGGLVLVFSTTVTAIRVSL